MKLELLLNRKDIPSEVKEDIKEEIYEFKKTKTRLEYLLQSGPAIIYSCEPCGDYQTTFMTNNAKLILGYTPQEFLYNPKFWFNRIHPDDKKQTLEAFCKIAEKASYNHVYRFLHNDGTYRWMFDEANLISDEQGNPIEVVGYWTDITQRKQAEEALKESEELFTQFMDNLPAAAFIKDKNSRMVFFNQFLKDTSGREKLIEKNTADLFPEDAQRTSADNERVMKRDLLVSMEEITNENNELNTYQSYLFPIKRKGKPDLFGGIAFDVTEQKLVGQKLVESELKFRTFIESLPELVWIYQDYQCRYANPAVKDITGYSLDEIMSMKFWDFLHSDYKNIAIEGGKLLKSNLTLPNNSSIVKILTKGGDEKWIDLQLELIEFEGKRAALISGRDITERKQAEEKLEYQANLLRNVSDALIATDLDFYITSWNKAAEEIYGWKEEEVLGKQVTQLLKQEFPNNEREDVIKLFKKEGVWKGEVTQKNKDGTLLNILSSVSLVKDKNEKPVAVIAANRDITERKSIEHALQQSEERLDLAIKSTNLGIWDRNIQTGLVVRNEQAAQICGYSLEEMDESFAWWESRIHPDDKSDVLKKRSMHLQGFTPIYESEYRILHRSGEWKWIFSRGKVVERDNDGKALRITGTFIDITSRKKTEKALKKSEEKYRFLFESAPVGIGVSDIEGNFIEGNKKIQELSGYTLDEIKKQSTSDMYAYSEDREKIIEKLQTLGQVRDYEVMMKRKDGTNYYALLDITLMELDDQKILLTLQRDLTKLKQAELTIRESEEKYRLFFETAPIGIGISNFKGEVLEANQKILEMTGYSFDEIKGINIKETFVNETDEDYLVNELIRVGYVHDFEVLLKRKDGTSYYALLDINLTKLANQDVFFTVQRDLTEQKYTEMVIRQNETKYRLLFESAPIGIGICDLNGNVLDCNQRILETTGCTIEEVKNVFTGDAYVYPGDRSKMLSELHEKGQVRNFETQLKRKNGTTYYAQLNINTMELDNKQVFLITQRDLTEWREINKAKRESEERLISFMESATDGFTLLDSKLNFIDINKSGLDTLGISKEELLGKHILDVFPNLEEIGRYQEFKRVVQTGKPYIIDDIITAPKIGKKYYSIRVFKVGEGLGIITTDITDRAKTEKTRKELEHKRDSFVWMTSHELRTPLTVLTGYCDFMIEHYNDLTQERVMNILSVMKNNLDRLERLTDEVSTIVQFQQGLFDLEKTDIYLYRFLQVAVTPYKQLLGEQFDFQGDPKDQSIIVEGDPSRLQQVLDNIIGNAIKQTDKRDRKIDVTLKTSQDQITLEISDNGAGIDPINLKKIFDQFVSIPTEYAASGTGIGLYISKKILEIHKGALKVRSKGLRQGSTFIIELPIKSQLDSRNRLEK